MNRSDRSGELARGWIEAWIRRDLHWLRKHLAGDFVHTSPFGRLEGRDHYLDTVAPMAQKSVNQLIIKDVIADGDQAAIRFENHTPGGVVQTCDWVRVDSNTIVEIRSFYDSAAVREVLSEEDQDALDGTY